MRTRLEVPLSVLIEASGFFYFCALYLTFIVSPVIRRGMFKDKEINGRLWQSLNFMYIPVFDDLTEGTPMEVS